MPDVGAVAEADVTIVDTPFGKRPFRLHIDPSQDGAEIVNGVAVSADVKTVRFGRFKNRRAKHGVATV